MELSLPVKELDSSGYPQSVEARNTSQDAETIVSLSISG